jgi:molybdopterin converting factor small subunit
LAIGWQRAYDQARERFFALIREKVGTDDERALREQKLMAEISVRLAQATVGSPIVWDQCRQEIISAIDAYADYCRTHAPEIRQAGLKIARAAVPKK